jgi:hypothetical protein
MLLPLSVLGGLLLAGYCVSRIREKRGRKSDVVTLFGAKQR